ncbi:flagellar hook-associated protein FlgK [Acidithiobacillus sp. HP-6]|uniref:flagellar hook-associated protein FlgK n=1 Tax=unclassified Acidithiobacillus TaxID=2614800 RepID=UPI0018794E19|nr:MULTISPECIES: flagellar hook-associated protein FlgK [unclassified Acidithiobacillus]MBE7562861.1 flagellar hook-associated protein FlgK [Acidithiobacillus sp. HP-6]MBE7568214.1 flagellar hook-associated protein FlgK [Acidithiobacillus sp. HP-2]
MSGISGLVNNALTGLQAAQSALQVVGDNIANVNTPGYSQQSALQSTAIPTAIGGLYYGNGTQVDSVQRSYSSFLQGQVWTASASASGQASLSSSLQNILGMLNNGGVSSQVSQFFSGVAQVAASPDDIPARQSMLSNAQTLSQTFQSLGQQLASVGSGVNQQITQSVDQINSISKQIAQLNVQISAAQGNPNGSPNDLLDQRDHLITELNGQVGVQVLKQQNSQLSVFLSNGQVLVAGGQSFALQTQSSPYNQQTLDVGYANNGADISKSLTGGTLGGLLQFRSQSLNPAENGLGLLADGIASALNAQQAQGLNLNGSSGSALFSTGAVQVFANTHNSSGAASVLGTITNVGNLSGNDYILTKSSGFLWTLQDRSTGATVASTSGSVSSGASTTSLNFSGVGFQLQVSGTAAAGDSFLVEPTRQGAVGMQTVLTDPAGIAAASPFVSSPGMLVSGSLQNNNLGNMTLSAGQYVSDAAGVRVPPSDISSFPTNLQITMTSGASQGGSATFQISSGLGTGLVIGSGTVSLGGSGTLIDIPYPNPTGGYWQVNLSGTLAASGDAFTLNPGGAGSNGNAQAMAALATSKVLNNGTATFNDNAAQLLTQVTNQAAQAQNNAQAQLTVLQSAQASQQAVSGVNLDQEAASLIQYQQAYQAAAKAISVGSTLFQSLIQAL